MSRRWPGWLGKVSAGILGGFLVAVAGTMGIALYAPAPERDRMLAAGLSFVPLWVTALCLAGLSRSGRRAWLVNGAVFLVMASLATARLVWG
ncbi:MAG: hypothetical protein AAGF23_11725 [Acidobacteriota bacterium]